jgi:hypothetical protein
MTGPPMSLRQFAPPGRPWYRERALWWIVAGLAVGALVLCTSVVAFIGGPPQPTRIEPVNEAPIAPPTRVSSAPQLIPEPTVTTNAPLPTTQAPEPPSVTTEAPEPPAEPTPGRDVYYRNCAEARAAGAAPLYRGEPGYRSGLDRDHDGVACEN